MPAAPLPRWARGTDCCDDCRVADAGDQGAGGCDDLLPGVLDRLSGSVSRGAARWPGFHEDHGAGGPAGGWPVIGAVVLAIANDPQSTRAWSRGAAGEEKLAIALVDLPQVRLLHDRRVPGSRGNIDHIAIAPGGVSLVEVVSIGRTAKYRRATPQ